MDIISRAKSLLSCKQPFGLPAEEMGVWPIHPPAGEQHILRMMVKTPKIEAFQIPPELEWLTPIIGLTYCTQEFEAGIPTKFVYVTVRHGVVRTKTDDTWHVDGFSMRVPHPPEQNYVWASAPGTELLDQPMLLPDDFDPMKHNIHKFFQDVGDERNVRIMEPGKLWRIDPYVIHRRPKVAEGTRRTFFRISYVPIEIEDDTCMINPLIPREKPYGRRDIRRDLERYENRRQSH